MFASPFFEAVRIGSGHTVKALARSGVSEELRSRLSNAPRGACVFRGIPFDSAHLDLYRIGGKKRYRVPKQQHEAGNCDI